MKNNSARDAPEGYDALRPLDVCAATHVWQQALKYAMLFATAILPGSHISACSQTCRLSSPFCLLLFPSILLRFYFVSCVRALRQKITTCTLRPLCRRLLQLKAIHNITLCHLKLCLTTTKNS